MAADTKRTNVQTTTARRHSLHRQVGRRAHGYFTVIFTFGSVSVPCHT